MRLKMRVRAISGRALTASWARATVVRTRRICRLRTALMCLLYEDALIIRLLMYCVFILSMSCYQIVHLLYVNLWVVISDVCGDWYPLHVSNIIFVKVTVDY